jgi:hypothetical protein
MDKGEHSIENLLANMSATRNEQGKTIEWGMRDFNNVETADRKLLVNRKYEFWVHDDALAHYSDYFAELFGKTLLNNTTIVDTTTHGDEDYKKSEITLPHEHLFFDVLLWIYNRDTKKLKKAAKTFHPFLYLISLGIFLKMKAEFFEILLTKPNFDWNIEYFNDPIWSKTIFTFPILETIVEQMKTNNFTKLIALLSWLKEIDPVSKNVVQSEEIDEEILTSHDLFLVRNYIRNHNLMSGLSGKEISQLIEKFPRLHSSFDTSTLINEFIFSSEKKLNCLICKKEFDSPFQVLESPECKDEYYHPKNNVNLKNEKLICSHEGCIKKFSKSEYPCCHKTANSQGCVIGEGKHMIVLGD